MCTCMQFERFFHSFFLGWQQPNLILLPFFLLVHPIAPSTLCYLPPENMSLFIIPKKFCTNSIRQTIQ